MTLRRSIGRLWAVAGLGWAQLSHAPGRSVLAVAGVAIAVLSITLLSGLGLGVMELGQESIDDSGRDIWISGGPGAEASTTTENEVTDASTIATEIRDREDVDDVSTIAMHEVYVGTDPDRVERVTAVGVEGIHTHFEFDAGEGFAGAAYNPHDAEDDPDEQPSDVIVLDPAVADRFDVGVGDTVYVGGSQQDTQSYTVVGIGSYYAEYLGTDTVTMQLDELQHVTGTAGSDRAAFVTVNTGEADREAVYTALQESYPAYDIRTSDDQFTTLVADRLAIVAAGGTLVAVAIVGGVALTANLFVLIAAHQRETLAALRAIGLSRGLLAALLGVQGTLIGLLGGLVGLSLTPLLAAGLNRLSIAAFGFERIVRPTIEVYALGAAVALVVASVVAVGAGWLASRFATLETLRSN